MAGQETPSIVAGDGRVRSVAGRLRQVRLQESRHALAGQPLGGVLDLDRQEGPGSDMEGERLALHSARVERVPLAGQHITKGKQFLYSLQRPEGRWETDPQRKGNSHHEHPKMQGSAWGGFTAISTYALLAETVPRDARPRQRSRGRRRP